MNKNTKLIISLIAAVLVLIALILVFLFGGSGSEEQPVSTTEPSQTISEEMQSYPARPRDHVVYVGGKIMHRSTSELDLSWVTPAEASVVAEDLAQLPELTRVQLMREDGTSALGLTDVKALQDARPDVFFYYAFELFGKTVTTEDERIEYDEVPIGDEGEEKIRQALDILTSCTYFKLDDCGVSTPVMASIRDDYPDVKVVWRIYIEIYNMLTDEKVLRLTHLLHDGNTKDLIYMTETTHMDLGHNTEMTDISFVEYMPNLECIIISGAQISDISPLASCKKLLWAELCFNVPLKDISPLADHPTLKYLNISYTNVRDISAVENIALDRFNCIGNKIPADVQNDFVAKHPDCITVFTGKQPYGYGWRYNDYGYTYFDYYANMRELFGYGKTYGNHKER